MTELCATEAELFELDQTSYYRENRFGWDYRTQSIQREQRHTMAESTSAGQLAAIELSQPWAGHVRQLGNIGLHFAQCYHAQRRFIDSNIVEQFCDGVTIATNRATAAQLGAPLCDVTGIPLDDCREEVQTELWGVAVLIGEDAAEQIGMERCEHCDAWHWPDDMESVESQDDRRSWRTNTESWCQDCVESDSAECTSCSTRYSADHLHWSDYYDGDICNSCSENVYTCEDCGEEFHCDDCHSCGADDDGISEYHGDSVRDNWNDPTKSSWGAEIELVYSDGETTADIAHRYDWAAERDGSLDDSSAELISPPMEYAELAKELPELADKLTRAGCRAWNKDGYGIHISLHSDHFKSRLHLAKFKRFIELDVSGLTTLIAGRSETSYARQHCGNKIGDCVKNLQTGKYSRVNIRGDRVEVRAFRSTLDSLHIIADLQFVRACLEFSAELSMSTLDGEQSELVETFFQWLGKQSRKDFGQLRKYFGRYIDNCPSWSKELGAENFIPVKWGKPARATV